MQYFRGFVHRRQGIGRNVDDINTSDTQMNMSDNNINASVRMVYVHKKQVFLNMIYCMIVWEAEWVCTDRDRGRDRDATEIPK